MKHFPAILVLRCALGGPAGAAAEYVGRMVDYVLARIERAAAASNNP
jgi:hypothetical protein